MQYRARLIVTFTDSSLFSKLAIRQLVELCSSRNIIIIIIIIILILIIIKASTQEDNRSLHQ